MTTIRLRTASDGSATNAPLVPVALAVSSSEQPDRLEPIRHLRIGLHSAHRVHGSHAHQRDLQLVSEVLQYIQELPLFGDVPGQNVMNFVNDQQPQQVEPFLERGFGIQARGKR